MLNEKIKKLLSKLYNLRGEDSVILASLESESKNAEDLKEKSNASKIDLEDRISSLNMEKDELSTEGARLVNCLSLVHKNDYEKVLDSLNIDFDPEKIMQIIEEKLPGKIEKLINDIALNNEELNQVINVLDESNAKISELEFRKEAALAGQESLNHYIDLALSGNDNITRDEITTLLANFDFEEEEQRELAKVLMFPEDGLLEFDKLYKNHELDVKPEIIKEEIVENSVINEPVEEDKSASFPPVEEISLQENITQSDEEDITEPVVLSSEEEKINIPLDPIVLPSIEIPEKEVSHTEVPEEENKIQLSEEPKQITNEILIKKLEELGFDYLDFTSNDFAKMLDNYNEEVFTKNVKFIESKKIDKEIFLDNIELLYDTEIENKVNKLMEVGKLPEDIYLNPSILTKYSYGELNEAIDILNASGLNPKDVPLMAY